MKLTVCFLLTYLFALSEFSYSQVILTRYVESNKSIALGVKLSPVELLLVDYKNSAIIKPGYFDEGSPDKLALPSKTFILGLPNEGKPKLTYKVKQQQKLDAKLSVNPLVKLANDSTLSYDYSCSSPKINIDREKVVSAGYMKSDKILYAVCFVKQYYYVAEENSIFQIDEIEITFAYESTIRSAGKEELKLGKIDRLNPHPEILNYEYAKKYQTAKSIVAKKNINDDWIDYNRTYLKIGVSSDAVYRIYYEDLVKAGFNPQNINPIEFVLIRKGQTVPFFLSSGSRTYLTAADYIEFIGEKNAVTNYREVSKPGEPYNEYYNRYSDTTIYWLTVGNQKEGVIAGSENILYRPDADTLRYYYELVHIEKNLTFDYSYPDLVKREMPFWFENKTWHESLLGVGPNNISVNIAEVFPDLPFRIYAKLQDYASDIVSGAHSLSIGINGENKSDNILINKYQQVVLSKELNSSFLVNGTNTINVYSSPTAAQLNTCIFDWSEIEYPRRIKAINDSLTISFPQLSGQVVRNIRFENLHPAKYVIWNYGPRHKRYSVDVLVPELVIADSIDSNSKIFITREEKVLKPKIYYAKRFKNLRSVHNKADYLLITDRNFAPAANEYLNFISSSYKLNTKLVLIEDIYDEFSFGCFSPEAIRDFLQSTHSNWQQPVPSNVFMVGSANYDYRRNKYFYSNIPEPICYVPSFGAPVSDSWFVIWDTTGAFIPQMNIGRLPISTNEEFELYAQKHKNLFCNRYNAWNKRFLFFSGGTGNDQNVVSHLRSLNEQIINDFIKPAPIGGEYTHFYKTLNPVSNFGPYSPAQIQTAIDSGAIFISYIGHSGTQTWDNSITDPSQLANKINRYPLITDFGCSTARFAEPDVTSFSQLFVSKLGGQAIAYIANSSLGFTSTSYSFPKIFYKKMLIDSVRCIGDIHRLAKIELLETYGPGNVYQLFCLTNTLIGDPIINIPIPTKLNLSIAPGDINLLTAVISDAADSVKININYSNRGLALSDSLTIHATDVYEGKLNFETRIKRMIPLNTDNVVISVPVKNKSGLHELKVRLETAAHQDEIYKDDNEAAFKLFVPSGAIKTLNNYDVQGVCQNPLVVLNPSNNPGTDRFIVELSSRSHFDDATKIDIKFDSLITKVNIPDSFLSKRIWMRTRISSNASYNNPTSFFIKEKQKYLLDDSLSLSSVSLNRLRIAGEQITLDSNKVKLKVLSAGFNDGNTALIELNEQNLIPENTLRGHNVVLLKDSTFEFVKYFLFDLYGDSKAAHEYGNLLDTLSQKYLVLFAVSDEGTVSSASLRDKIKMFGSKFIDKIKFRNSWAMVGKKGALPGSVPEAYAPMFGGRVQIDSTITTRYTSGSFITGKIGPAAGWKALVLQDNAVMNSSVIYKLLGIKIDESTDTLATAISSNSIIDLSTMDAIKYPFIKVIGRVSAQHNSDSPRINSLAVDYINLPELALNYQTVMINKDTLTRGEPAKLSFFLTNVGETNTDNFKVKVEVVKQDNSQEQVFEQIVSSIAAGDRKLFNVEYNTAKCTSTANFIITADCENSIKELYKDNNIFSVPFIIKENELPSSLSILFDGKDITDGDYISSTPNIRIELTDPSFLPVSDTNRVRFYLNDKVVSYLGGFVSYNFSEANPKFTIDYKPVLADGSYELKVVTQNSAGVSNSTSNLSRKFIVSAKLQLLYVYNYPNPFSGETYFTFKLSQIPDEMKIKLFTVAGRQIKEINISPSELKYDFNKIYWDGRDNDANLISNGVYFYKIIARKGRDAISEIRKLAVVR